MEERYLRNLGPLTEAEQALLASKTVFLAGLGGLGGHLLEHMLRLGVGAIVAADGDRFTLSNLNRQLLATEDAMGQPKAQAAAERAAAVNPGVRVTVVSAPLTARNRDALLAGCDLALDGLDNLEARRILAARRYGHMSFSGLKRLGVVRPGGGDSAGQRPAGPHLPAPSVGALPQRHRLAGTGLVRRHPGGPGAVSSLRPSRPPVGKAAGGGPALWRTGDSSPVASHRT